MDTYKLSIEASKATIKTHQSGLITVELQNVLPTEIIEEIGLVNLLEDVSLEDLEEIINTKREEEDKLNDQLRDKALRG